MLPDPQPRGAVTDPRLGSCGMRDMAVMTQARSSTLTHAQADDYAGAPAMATALAAGVRLESRA
jgi:hypothetical protein